MFERASMIILIGGMLCGCAVSTPQVGFAGERTVFYNPYSAPELKMGPVGPGQCEECSGDDGRWFDGLFYPGAGHYAFDRSGNRVLLSRADRRELRQRAGLIGDQAEINRKVAEFNAHQAAMPDPPLPHPTAPPTALRDYNEPPVPAASTPASRGAVSDNREMPR